MNIAWYDVGNRTNEYCGSDGGSYIRIPLLRELNIRGHQIDFLRQDPDNYEYSEAPLWSAGAESNVDAQRFLDECYRFRDGVPFTLDLDATFVGGKDFEKYDAVVAEARASRFEQEFGAMTQTIRRGLEQDIPVLVFDRNNWAQEMPHDLLKQVTILGPYFELPDELRGYDNVHFPYWYYPDVPNHNVTPTYDLVYVGNRYGREEQMDNFLDGLQDLDIMVAGNWPQRDQEVTEKYPDVDFIGPTPHFATIPLLGLGKATFHVGKPDYNEIGMLTMRPYEAFMANRPCFISDNIDKVAEFVPDPLHISDADRVKSVLEDSMLQQQALSWYSSSDFLRPVDQAASHLNDVIEKRR